MLRRFAAYLDRRFDFRSRLKGLSDGRLMPQIPTANIWLPLFAMFVLRLGSFNALEMELRRPKRWESLIKGRRPSADTLGRVCAKFSKAGLRALLLGLNRQAWRSKGIHGRVGQLYRVVAVDGHELFASRARCCASCQVRELEVEGQKVLEYYHRVVVAQWVGVTPAAIVDVEPVGPGEGEVVAARRLVARILCAYPRLIDVISADALYLEAPFINIVLNAGRHVVITLKQEAREIYQDAQRLRSLLAPQRIEDPSCSTRCWDLSNLCSFSTLGRPMRVVWAEEQTQRRKIVAGKPTLEQEEKTWIWVTDLAPSSVPATTIRRWGHDRWDLENRGFNELSALWHMDHCFIHHPIAIEVLLLTLACAFLTTCLFYERNLKAPARCHLNRLALSARLMEDFSLLQGAPLWPSAPDSS